MVCKQFCEVFQQNQHLSQFVLLTTAVDHKNVQSLQIWLANQPARVVRLSLMGVAREWQTAVLSAFVSRPHKSSLNYFIGIDVPATAVSLLAEIHSLHTCCLKLAPDQHLDLAPLHTLPHLSQLLLVGPHDEDSAEFSGLHMLSHVTTLTLNRACAGEETDLIFAFTSTLQVLTMFNSVLDGLSDGLAACTNLHTLELVDDCFVTTSSINSTWATYNGRVGSAVSPADMSALLLLTKFMYTLTSNTQQSDIDWTWQLSQLEHLKLMSASKMEIGPSVSGLPHLTFLELCGCDDARSDVIWKLAFDMGNVGCLQELRVSFCQFQFRDQVLGLVHVWNLRQLGFINCQAADAQTASKSACLQSAMKTTGQM